MTDTRPLNILKYCPKCGSEKFLPSGERSLKCADCGFHYFVNASAAVAALITNEEGKLMLVTRGVEPGYGKLDLPGGFVDPLESAEDAVRRELKEELGLKVKNLEYLFSAPNEYLFSGLTVFTLDLAFKVTVETPLENLNAMDDILAYHFYTEEEFDYKNIPAPSINSFVRRFFKGRNSIL